MVALLAEGVDRNHDYFTSCLPYPVALLAEGVDRNINWRYRHCACFGRPPRGGRG